MKIFISHSTVTDYEKEIYNPIKSSELTSSHEFIFPMDDVENVASDVRNVLLNKEIELVIADVSIPSHGVGMEMAWAYEANIPIVCIYKDGSELAESLEMVTKKFLMYTNAENMMQDLKDLLKNY